MEWIYLDWIDDADYLKRNLLCDATLNVIKNRMDISNKLIFVKLSLLLMSLWCMYELNYYIWI